MNVLHILFLFLAFAAAAPTSISNHNSPTSPTLANSPTHSSSAHRATLSPHLPITHPHFGTTTHGQPAEIITRPTIPTRARESIFPLHTHARPPPPPVPPASDSTQKPISIAFEVLGGLLGSLILLSLIRCCVNYKKTPHRDRIADILHRHNLQRELEELERNPAVLRRPSLREPAPPYFPRPPSYDEMNPPQPVRTVPPSEYSAVATSSPPPSPPMSQIILPGPTVTARTPPDLIPPIPSG